MVNSTKELWARTVKTPVVVEEAAHNRPDMLGVIHLHFPRRRRLQNLQRRRERLRAFNSLFLALAVLLKVPFPPLLLTTKLPHL